MIFMLFTFIGWKKILDIRNKDYYTITKLMKIKFRITPIIWFGGLYQEPIILDYEEDTIICIFFVVRNFFYDFDNFINIYRLRRKI